MTDNEMEMSALDNFPLPQTMRPGWKADEIIYTRYTFDPADPQATLKGAPRSLAIPRTDIEAFVRERLAGGGVPEHGEILERGRCDPHKDPDRPIDIYVRGPCYVVIELDPKLQWQFQPGKPAITAWVNNLDDNGDLHHVMSANGEILDGEGPDGDGCRIAYFGVNRRCRFEHQKFVCNVESGPPGFREPVTVDPDIPNDGGKFPFIGRAGQLRGPTECEESGE